MASFLLLESGDAVLLEDGSVLLLEDGSASDNGAAQWSSRNLRRRFAARRMAR